MGPTAWVRKAISEYEKDKKVVFVFSMDKWVHLFMAAGAEFRSLGDVKWGAIGDATAHKGTGRNIAAFILDPTKTKKP